MRKTTIALAAMLGVFIGVGIFTFNYAEGFSYFSTDPQACANCHIMNDAYASWSKAGHHTFAKCIDCHLPHEGLPKLVAKARNGWNHSSAFTLQNFHEPILITPSNAQILQDNCLRCHGDFVHDIVAGSSTAANAVKCVHCHASVGHGARR